MSLALLAEAIEKAGVNGRPMALRLAQHLLEHGNLEVGRKVVEFFRRQAQGRPGLLIHLIQEHGPRRMEIYMAIGADDREYSPHRLRQERRRVLRELEGVSNREIRRSIVARHPHVAETYDALGLDY